MADAHPAVAEQFEDMPQQKEASLLGMWTFLATEILFFGGMFLSYTVYRHAYPAAFAQASRHTLVLYGSLNTGILLTSSLTMALAVRASHEGNRRTLVRGLLLTIVLGASFLGIKGLEYAEDIHEKLVPGPHFTPELPLQTQIFWFLYWAMTGLHALHVTAGVGILSVLAWFAHRGKFNSAYHNPVEICGLYWHFVDIVWIYLYPLLYLIDRSA